MKRIKKIIIVNTTWYCGGALVLSELCRCLNDLGYDAKLFLFRDFPRTEQETKNFSKLRYTLKQIKYIIGSLIRKRNTPIHLRKCKIQRFPFFSRDTIVLYPEDLFGNPLKAKNVIRWFLYHYRYTDTPNAYSQSDCFITYREIFNDSKLNPSGKCVHLTCFDSELYKCTNFKKRSGNCYIVRKGKNRDDLPQTFDGPVIDNLSEEEKVRILNECEYCYSYDTQTFYSSIAAVCGCKSIVKLEFGKSKEDYLGKDDQEPYGVAYGDSPDELKRAEATRQKLIESLDFNESNRKNAEFFLKIIVEHFIR